MIIALLEEKIKQSQQWFKPVKFYNKGHYWKFKELVTSVINVYAELIAIAKSFEPTEAPIVSDSQLRHK